MFLFTAKLILNIYLFQAITKANALPKRENAVVVKTSVATSPGPKNKVVTVLNPGAKIIKIPKLRAGLYHSFYVIYYCKLYVACVLCVSRINFLD